MNTFVTLSLILGASALSPRSCSFGLTASGGESGAVGQLSDGQIRIGGSYSPATFTIDNGGIYDSAGRGCVLTPSIEQYQCDEATTPTYGFAITSNGTLALSGSSTFYACPASDTEWNVYTTPVPGQLKCVEITLTASGCAAASSSSTPTSSALSSVAQVTTVTVYNCALTSIPTTLATSAPIVSTSVSVSEIASSNVVGTETYVPTSPASTPIKVSTTAVEIGSTTSPAVVETSSPVEASTAIESISTTTPVVIASSSTPIIVESTTPVQAPTSTQSVSMSVPVASTSSVVVTPTSTPVTVESSTAPLQSTTPVVVASSTSSIEVPLTTSTVYTTSVYTITSCAATVTNCPARIGLVTTETISLYMTICPVTETETPTSSVPVQISATATPIQTQSASVPATTPASSSTTEIETQNTWTSIATTFETSTTKLPTWTSVWANTTTSASTSIASATSSASTCVSTVLSGSSTSGNYQYPHLIVPVSSTSPTTAAGTQYFGTISANTSTIFNFDIPASYSGHTCSLIFLLPLLSQLETSAYTFSGTGEVDFEQLSSVASTSTTYDNAPSVEKDLGYFTLTEGSSTLVQTFACPAGETVTYELSALGDTYLYYFQDWNPSPLGLFITYC